MATKTDAGLDTVTDTVTYGSINLIKFFVQIETVWGVLMRFDSKLQKDKGKL